MIAMRNIEVSLKNSTIDHIMQIIDHHGAEDGGICMVDGSYVVVVATIIYYNYRRSGESLCDVDQKNLFLIN